MLPMKHSVLSAKEVKEKKDRRAIISNKQI